jgi:hypothetical protein
MNRRSRMLLGASVALITAISLHLTVGERYNRRMHGRYSAFGCGRSWKDRHGNDHKAQAEPLKGPTGNANKNF